MLKKLKELFTKPRHIFILMQSTQETSIWLEVVKAVEQNNPNFFGNKYWNYLLLKRGLYIIEMQLTLDQIGLLGTLTKAYGYELVLSRDDKSNKLLYLFEKI